ncbi:hypothetical protein TWF703_002437 [Orbilia oligospora]|uniref:Nucleoside phosphorylase domain-containing protein n=1 Tax=Orbilia oligospora TaxID=2813651 RepID=A0A7C8NYK2_ORBOL|nr:hypothetical protein TWF703_002437 [Orbilia oligospora]
MTTQRSHDDYTVGWICALPKEQTAAILVLDEEHEDLTNPPWDKNAYILGSMGQHNVAITCLPIRCYGTNQMAATASIMAITFPSIKITLMVGIGGGIPSKVKLGDVVISTEWIQWDMGKTSGDFELNSRHFYPPKGLSAAMSKLQAQQNIRGTKIEKYLDDIKRNNRSLPDEYTSAKGPEGSVDPRRARVHYGLIASGNQVIKNAQKRDEISKCLGNKPSHINSAQPMRANLPQGFGVANLAHAHPPSRVGIAARLERDIDLQSGGAFNPFGVGETGRYHEADFRLSEGDYNRKWPETEVGYSHQENNVFNQRQPKPSISHSPKPRKQSKAKGRHNSSLGSEDFGDNDDAQESESFSTHSLRARVLCSPGQQNKYEVDALPFSQAGISSEDEDISTPTSIPKQRVAQKINKTQQDISTESLSVLSVDVPALEERMKSSDFFADHQDSQKAPNPQDIGRSEQRASSALPATPSRRAVTPEGRDVERMASTQQSGMLGRYTGWTRGPKPYEWNPLPFKKSSK